MAKNRPTFCHWSERSAFLLIFYHDTERHQVSGCQTCTTFQILSQNLSGGFKLKDFLGAPLSQFPKIFVDIINIHYFTRPGLSAGFYIYWRNAKSGNLWPKQKYNWSITTFVLWPYFKKQGNFQEWFKNMTNITCKILR